MTELRRGVVEHCVLALLEHRPQYAYDLVTALGRHAPLVTSEGTIYPLLSRLRRAGTVTTFLRESDVGPPRRYYELTADGRKALAEFRTDWVTFRDATDTILETGGLGPATEAAP
ncbi:PadR family transcriptional regulator [Salsipaludibacter albus]|uniref:PadR family transcriptional regulator n=1 Tax=Salsipaludibacter albus TaxID=2849650 RepID=UPI001EE4011F|nr:PadR family transcriptional regulator [Salsipaludibacter albus]